jgi:vitamin B12 transporter
VTAAYEISETGSRFHASVGTGAKRQTAYQIANNVFESVSTDLSPEKSVGADAGVEQSFLGGRVRLSATGFWTGFQDMILFHTTSFPDGYYENIKIARTAGIEVSADLEIVPGVLHAEGSYTYLDARDLSTHLFLERRPRNAASASLTFTGFPNFETTLTATYVGDRFNDRANTQPLTPYARLDLTASYDLNPHVRLFGRVENLTNATYQDPRGFNTAGLSAYAGLRWTSGP